MNNDPRRAYPTRPVTDDHSATVLHDAVHTLTMLRAPMHEGDACAALHAVVSLIDQARAALPKLVVDARDQDHTWAEIAGELGITRTAAIIRYAGRTTTRRTPLDRD